MPREMSPSEFVRRAAGPDAPVLLDVREDWELAIARIGQAQHIPMGQIPDRLEELDRNREIVVLCRSGGRSAQVARFLEQQGFQRVRNLAGGVLAWSEQVDSTIQPY